MPINAIRRSLAKFINRTVDRRRCDMRASARASISSKSARRRELCNELGTGSDKAAPPPTPKAGQPPWQIDPAGPASSRNKIIRPQLHCKQIYERSVRFGDVNCLRRGRGTLSLPKGRDHPRNDFAPRNWAARSTIKFTVVSRPMRRRFLTRDRTGGIRLILLRRARSCEDVSKYDFTFKASPMIRPGVEINDWLKYALGQLEADQSRW